MQSCKRLAMATSLVGGVEIDRPGVIPIAHDGKSVEQWHLTFTGDPAHVVRIGFDRNHQFRPWIILHIYEDNVYPRRLQFFHAVGETG